MGPTGNTCAKRSIPGAGIPDFCHKRDQTIVNTVHIRCAQLDDFTLLAIVLILGLLAVPVSIVVLFLRTGALKDRIGRLEQALNDRSAGLVTGQAPVAGRLLSEMDRTPGPGITIDPALEDPLPAPAPIPQPQSPSPWDKAVTRRPAAATTTTAATAPPALRVTAEAAAIADAGQNQPIVFRPDRTAALTLWIKVNWIYIVSAASLGLAGIFFVQYGMERGLLPPGLRVMAAIVFGAGLIAAGEWIRRTHGDEGQTTTLHLPSVFSGAGLVSIFAAVLSARHLYGLIGPETAFAGLVATGVLAMVLGWFYGPLLSAVGLIGAALAPVLVAGGTSAEPWLYAYHAVIAATGLAVDAVRRWAWVSVLALTLGYGGVLLAYAAGAGDPGWAVVLLVLALMATIIPPLSLTPRHGGPATLQALLRLSDGAWPIFPTRLAAGAVLASSIGLLVLDAPFGASLLAPFALALLALAWLFWANAAKGLTDLALLPAGAFLIWLLMQGTGGDALRAFQALAIGARPPETPGPLTITLLTALATAISGFAALRALRHEGPFADLVFGLMAVLVAPVTVLILELLWVPAPVIGLPLWAAHIVAMAALMTLLATRFAATDDGRMHRAAYAVLSGLSLAALALFVMTTATALTLALGVLIVAAAALDRRFNLPEMGLFVQAGVAVLTWRLLIDPGLDFADTAPLLAVILSFGGSIAALLAARTILPARPLTRAVLESAGGGLIAVFANVLLIRLVIPDTSMGLFGHWALSVQALPWLILMLAQLYRTQASPVMRRLRLALSTIAGVIAAVVLGVAVIPLNPLFSGIGDVGGQVQGPWILDTLFVAYAVPGLILLAGWSRLPGLPRPLRIGFFAIGAGLLALYAALDIRRWFQGDWLGAPGVMQGELYTYTLALMALGAGLLFQAIRHGSTPLRRMATGVIGLVIAKVFLIDAAGLTGLTRVVSFLGLGLSLAGLAWLNRWAEQAAAKES